MTKDEEIKHLKTKLVSETVKRIQIYDDAYPDVGMGKSWWVCLDEALKYHGYTKDEIYIDKV